MSGMKPCTTAFLILKREHPGDKLHLSAAGVQVHFKWCAEIFDHDLLGGLISKSFIHYCAASYFASQEEVEKCVST